MTSVMDQKSVPAFEKLYVGGEWVEPAGDAHIEVISPSTEEVISHVPEPTPADVDRAVAAARDAFAGPWRKTSPEERSQLLNRIADEVEKRVPEFAAVFAAEIGAPVALGGPLHGMAVQMLRQAAGLHERVAFVEDRVDGDANVSIVREPVGVVGAIIPWNAPVGGAALKLGSALAAGCTVVLKPAPEGPLTTYMLAECLEAAGVPEGVVSILPAGREVGEHLVRHPDVDKVTFTGSTEAGKRVGSLCGERIARVSLELGGKSAAIIADDAELGDVLPTLLAGGIGHSGQICAALTRVLVPRSRAAEFAEAMAFAMSGMVVGDPFDPATMLGPLAMERQRNRVESYIEIGRQEGAKIACGGGRPAHLDKGFYVEPTLFTDVDNSMRIAREEIFGPVISMISYDSIDEAIDIANDSPYGLSGSVYTNDQQIAKRVVSEVRTGQIFVNSHAVCASQPFGGFKQSGHGREGGPEGIAAYLETKMIQW